MNRNVIEEALDILRDVDVLNPERCAQVIDDAVRMVQAELDKAPKVLTDEEIERIAFLRWPERVFSNGITPPIDKNEGDRTAFVQNLRYARDHYGIGAHAAGLTVEEVVDVVDEWMREPDENGDYFKRDNLRTRIAAKLNTTEQ